MQPIACSTAFLYWQNEISNPIIHTMILHFQEIIMHPSKSYIYIFFFFFFFGGGGGLAGD